MTTNLSTLRRWCTLAALALTGLTGHGVALAQSDAYEQNKFVQATASVDVPSGLFSGGMNQAVRDRALAAAKAAALNTALSRVTGPKADVVNGMRKTFEERADTIITDVTVTDERHQEADRKYTVRIRATIQWGQVDSIIRTAGGAGGAAPGGVTQPRMTAAAGQRVLFLALAREASSIKRFDERRVEITRNSTGTTGESRNAEQTVNPTRSATVESTASGSMVTAEARRERGGSTTAKRDAIEYVPGNTSDLTTRIGQTLTQNTIRATPYGLAVAPCKLPNSAGFGDKFAESAEAKLPDETLGDIISKLQQCSVQIRYLIIASVDVDGYGKNPDGRDLASSIVRVQMYDVSDLLPEPVAVADGRAQGTATSQTDAIRAVMSRSADVASDKIVNILRTQLGR